MSNEATRTEQQEIERDADYKRNRPRRVDWLFSDGVFINGCGSITLTFDAMWDGDEWMPATLNADEARDFGQRMIKLADELASSGRTVQEDE